MDVNVPNPTQLPWQIVVSDLQGQVYGRPRTYDRNFTFPLSAPATVQFRTPLSDPWAGALTDDALIQVHFGADQLFHGVLTSYERVVDGQGNRSIAVTAQDPSFRLTRRLANRTGSVFVEVADRGQIVRNEIDRQNVINETGIRTGAQPYLSGTSVTYGWAPFHPVMEATNELATGVSGFEWRVMPIPYTAGKIGDWYAEPVNGRHLEGDVIFESGMGKNNVAEIRETGDLTTTANQVYHIKDAGAGAPDNPWVNQSDAESIAKRGLMQDIAAASGLDGSLTLRQDLVNEHVVVRKGFRRLVKISPERWLSYNGYRVPQFWTDYDVGDFIQLRAMDETGQWLDASVRIWQVSVAPDINGIDTISLTVEQE